MILDTIHNKKIFPPHIILQLSILWTSSTLIQKVRFLLPSDFLIICVHSGFEERKQKHKDGIPPLNHLRQEVTHITFYTFH